MDFDSLIIVQVNRIFADNTFDAVMHFAAVAYVGESTLEPLRYAILYSRRNLFNIMSVSITLEIT